MKYDGIELKEFTSRTPVVFDPPKKMIVWDDDDPKKIPTYEDWTCKVHAYIPSARYPVVADQHTYQHCAEIPQEPKPRRATNNKRSIIARKRAISEARFSGNLSPRDKVFI